MEQKLAELTNKIYQEGVQKGEEEARKVLDEAKAKASAIVGDAKKEAEKILADSKAQAAEQKRNTDSELKLSSQQAISAIKQQVVDLVTSKLIDESVGAALDNPDVIKDLIAAVVANWQSGEASTLEVLLPAAKQGTLESALKGGMKKLLNAGLTLNFTKAIKGGFQIGPADGGFKISLTDEDFNEFFKDFLRPKTKQILFGE